MAKLETYQQQNAGVAQQGGQNADIGSRVAAQRESDLASRLSNFSSNMNSAATPASSSGGSSGGGGFSGGGAGGGGGGSW